MEKNQIVEILERVIGTDKIEYISGNIENIGTNECQLSNERGSVYGFAILIESEKDKIEIFNKLSYINKLTSIKVEDRKTIGDNFYPLYWGKDVNMGIRLFSHTKVMKSTGTLQLCNQDYNILENRHIIYGALPCINYSDNEKKLKKKYPDILKTTTGNVDCISVK